MKIRIRLKSCDGMYIVVGINTGSCDLSLAIRITDLYKKAIQNHLYTSEVIWYQGEEIDACAKQFHRVNEINSKIREAKKDSQATQERYEESWMDEALRSYHS